MSTIEAAVPMGLTSAGPAARIAAVVLFLVVVWLVISRRLRIEYSAIWVLATSVAVALTMVDPLLVTLGRTLGAWTSSSVFFFLAVTFLALIVLQQAVHLSRIRLELKNLIQEFAILKSELEHQRSDQEVE